MYYANENFEANQGSYYNYFLIAAGLYVLYFILDGMGVFDGGFGGGGFGNDGGSCCVPCDADGNHELL